MEAKDRESNESTLQLIHNNPELDKQSYTPLMIASAEGNIQTVIDLVNSGADVHALSFLKSTPVMFAAQKGNFEIVKYLVDKGANLEHRNLSGWNTFIYAAGGNNLELVEWLIKQKKISLNADDVNTALLFAARYRNIEILYFIFKHFGASAGDNEKILGMDTNTCQNACHNTEAALLDHLNNARQILSLENNQVEELDLSAQPYMADLLLDRLPRNWSLKKLTYHFYPQGNQKLLEFLTYAKLDELTFMTDVRPITPDLAIEIFGTLSNNKEQSLKKLTLWRCEIGLEGAKALAKFIEQNETLECLNLGHCELGPAATKLIIQSINRNPKKLHTLNLRYNQMDIECSQSLVELLQNSACSLQSLNISANYIGDGLPMIGETIKTNTTLTKLNLSYMGLKYDNYVKTIADMIATNKTLTHLHLLDNEFTDDQGAVLIDALKVNTSLVTVELGNEHENCSFYTKTAQSLGEMFKCNKVLKEIGLMNHNKLGSEIKYFVPGLAQNNSLVFLDLAEIKIDAENYAQLLEMLLYHNFTLQCLRVTPRYQYTLDPFLKRNKTLASKELNISELKNIMDEIRIARWKKESPLPNQPYSLKFILGFYSNQLSNQIIGEAVNSAIQDQDKQELINSFLKH